MKVVIFTSSREAAMEEPVSCDRDTVKVDASKCTGSSITIAPHLARYLKDLGFHVVVVDPFGESYEADQVIKGTTFQVPDEVVKDSYVVVATRHVYDTWAIMKSIYGGAREIAVVMSLRRAKEIMKRLMQAGIEKEKLRKLRIPAGLDLGGKSEKEVALSIVAEILAVERGGSGRPLREVKGFERMLDEL
ncbi:MAG: Xanthine and CO dehydrogenases maturation factor, XdhC/CoxF family protein [Candidatus Aramenus sulfurataquae]|jgi:xanthine dehydrogenase accessory factor|uniref:Xanthine and CO dehydrogenases maturation factor, XdhC/CoxF family protein n=2 Tax=Candidatus Aramenus sulfurataquae TaxID=1326980 RepID=W7KHS4_9CREN|nr:MAG: Xanthine and CO dehydrogenases maturation factor, XdhC/CoxF family protein [Candidatus Aramenus sulfurataquae]MCL7344413.1 XdhC family protein [Candidatus Aramenus sulfurataquae]